MTYLAIGAIVTPFVAALTAVVCLAAFGPC